MENRHFGSHTPFPSHLALPCCDTVLCALTRHCLGSASLVFRAGRQAFLHLSLICVCAFCISSLSLLLPHLYSCTVQCLALFSCLSYRGRQLDLLPMPNSFRSSQPSLPLPSWHAVMPSCSFSWLLLPLLSISPGALCLYILCLRPHYLFCLVSLCLTPVGLSHLGAWFCLPELLPSPGHCY